MNMAEAYKEEKEILMDKYEKAIRQWLTSQNVNENIVRLIPFLEDGIVCPEIWFKHGNEFRPLFILKEASIGIDDSEDLEAFYQKWQSTKFDHVGDEYGDIRIGVDKFKGNNPWIRIVKLAYGLKNAYEKRAFCEYKDLVDVSFSTSEDRRNPNNKSEDHIYDYATDNENYISMINQIAVVNIKKIAGGTRADSELSKATMFYAKHLSETLANLFYIQVVELIKPTVIVFCSPQISRIIEKVYGNQLLDQFICLNGYHPTRNSTENFYNKPVNEYIKKLKGTN